MLQRRTFLGGLVGLGAVAAVPAAGRSSIPGVAVTIDDFDLTDTLLMTALERDEHIRAALGRHRIEAAGFVAGKYVHGPASEQVLSGWSREGHILGNHSFAHAYYGSQDPDAYMADILRCEGLLAGHPGFQKLFRYPFLAEGKAAEARDALRERLHAHGYRVGHVTIDASDWAVDGRLRKRLASDPKADLAPYRQFYLDHLWERASFYDGLAQKLFGHSIDHTLLLHHRLGTALFLDDILTMFRKRGWRLIDAQAAFASPVFALEPKSLPSGQSLVWAVAKERGGFDAILRYPGEDESYEAPKMDKLGL